MRRNRAQPSARGADQEGAETKKEEDGNARKKGQQILEIKTVEENRRRKSTTFKPSDSNNFQNTADRRVSFIGAVVATANSKLDREEANDSFQEYVLACCRNRRLGGLDGRFCARSLTGECG
jgi:hypothetical protein